jgi:hypothetical protein
MLQRMAQAPVGFEVFVMLRSVAVTTMVCAMASGCAGYQALIIPKPATATGAASTLKSGGIQVCERIAVREQRCTIMDRRDVQELYERARGAN